MTDDFQKSVNKNQSITTQVSHSYFPSFCLFKTLPRYFVVWEDSRITAFDGTAVNFSLQSRFPTMNLHILTHVSQSSQPECSYARFTKLEFEKKSFWRPDTATTSLYHKLPVQRGFQTPAQTGWHPRQRERCADVEARQQGHGHCTRRGGAGRKTPIKRQIELVLQDSWSHGCVVHKVWNLKGSVALLRNVILIYNCIWTI